MRAQAIHRAARALLIGIGTTILAGCPSRPSVPTTRTVTIRWEQNPAEDEVARYTIYERTGNALRVAAVMPGTAEPQTRVKVTQGVHVFVVVATNVWGEGESEQLTVPSG